MSTSSTLLALLEREPAHGYDLKHKYDTWFARKRPLAFGQVYSSLARFQRNGFAEVLEVEAGGGPERRRYRITSAGVATVEDWIFRPQDPEIFAVSSLYARVTVALLSGRAAEEVLDRQRQAHLARMRVLQRERKRAAAADLLAVTYELAHLDADLRWIEQSGQRLDTIGKQLQQAHRG
ncbi:MAG: helix-turn-helix transcriptional regulator [Gaiellales bacterium]